MRRREKTLHLHPRAELLAELEWVASFLQLTPHAFCLAAAREKLDRERERNPDIPAVPAGFGIPRTDDDD